MNAPSRGARLVALGVALACPTAEARADDFRIDAESVLQAYEVRSPGTAAFLTRRRFVQTLGLRYVRHLDPDDREESPRLTAQIDLRLDQEYGDTCLVVRDFCFRGTDRSDPATYQPLVDTLRLDAKAAYVELDALPLGGRLRAGRHLVMSTIGFLRIDGVSAHIEPTEWAAVEAYGGLVVRRTSFLGTSQFEPQGALRLDLDDVDPERIPYVAPPVTTYGVGGAIELGVSRIVRGRAELREVHDEDGVLARRFGIGLVSQPLDFLRGTLETVLDLQDGALIDAHAGLGVVATESLSLRADVERHVPRFDQGTIWAYFDLVPISEGRLGADVRLDRDSSVGLAVRGRVAAFAGDDERDTGVELSGDTRVLGARLGATTFFWGGALGPLGAAILTAERPIGMRFAVEGRASVWYFDDPLRQNLYGASFVEALGARWFVSERTTLRLDLEHAHSRVVGSRLRMLASLVIEVWR